MDFKKATDLFVNASRSALQRLPKDGTVDKKWIEMLEMWSNNKCFCGKSLEIISIKKTENGMTRFFKCGHAHTAISLKETVKLGEGFSASSLGQMPNGEQKISVRISGAQISKENGEIAVVKTLCHYFRSHLKTFVNDKQDSPIDVIAKDESGNQEYFQVTKLYDESFWRELSNQKRVDRIIPEITSLIKNAIERKKNFDTKSKESIILLIDAWPGAIEDFAKEVANLPILSLAKFKEVWIVGSVPETTFKIYPDFIDR